MNQIRLHGTFVMQKANTTPYEYNPYTLDMANNLGTYMTDTSPTTAANMLTFTESDTKLLGSTADALSAYMGKPVLAQLVNSVEMGFEWVIFAIPLTPEQNPNDVVSVNLGGDGGNFLGNQGGLNLDTNEEYVCEFMWAIQVSDIIGVRYIKVDHEGEEIAWTNDLKEILPFDINDKNIHNDDEIDDNQADEDYNTGNENSHSCCGCGNQ